MTTYAIGGANYVKLRDVGEAVGFNVYWDGSAVQVESKKPYTGTGPAAQTIPPTRQTFAVPTEEAVQAALMGLRERYPNHTSWPAPYRSTSGGPYHSGMNCAGWATLCSDAAFGDLPWRKINDPAWDQIRTGDLVQYGTSQGSHVVVVVSKTEDALFITDSGTTQKAYWGGKYFRWWLEEQPGLTLYTRYPS